MGAGEKEVRYSGIFPKFLRDPVLQQLLVVIEWLVATDERAGILIVEVAQFAFAFLATLPAGVDEAEFEVSAGKRGARHDADIVLVGPDVAGEVDVCKRDRQFASRSQQRAGRLLDVLAKVFEERGAGLVAI